MTIRRRDVLIGAVCLAGSAGALALTPRRRVSLMPDRRLELTAPLTFGTWSGRNVTDLVAPKIPGSLESKLYNQTLERVYTDAVTGSEVMVLLAHGDTQSNELQLHRPEVCYPAFGFEVSSSREIGVTLAMGVRLPARALVADAADRRENIVYWTRLGEYLPTSENQQRLDRVKTALDGVIADGLLARFSLVAQDSGAALSLVENLISQFVAAVAAARRPALIGTRLARAMAPTAV